MGQNVCGVTGKVIYNDRKACRTAIAHLSARRKHEGKIEQAYYPCQFCKGWHITTWRDNRPKQPRLPPHQRRWRPTEEHYHGDEEDGREEVAGPEDE